jgi:hypothetical protein
MQRAVAELCSLLPELASGATGCLRLFTDLPRQFQAFYEVEPHRCPLREIRLILRLSINLREGPLRVS